MKWVGANVLSRGITPSLFLSTAVHFVFFAMGLVSWNWFQSASCFPIDAVEIAAIDFVTKAGSARPSRPQKVAVVARQESLLDLAVKKAENKKEPVPRPAAVSAPSQAGQGGEAAGSRGRALSEWEYYQVRLRERIHQALIYPRSAKNLGESGRVTVAFAVQRDGTLSDIRVQAPCAFEKLNSAAVETVKRVARFDPLPNTVASARWDTFIPIDFALQ